MGHPRRRHPRQVRAPQPRTDPPPPRHPGLPAGAHRRQRDPGAPLGLYRIQRRLRRRPDGRARSPGRRGSVRGARDHGGSQEYPQARLRRPYRKRQNARHRARLLVDDQRSSGRERRRQDVPEAEQRRDRMGLRRGGFPREDQSARHRACEVQGLREQSVRDDRRPHPLQLGPPERLPVYQQGNGAKVHGRAHRRPHQQVRHRRGSDHHGPHQGVRIQIRDLLGHHVGYRRCRRAEGQEGRHREGEGQVRGSLQAVARRPPVRRRAA